MLRIRSLRFIALPLLVAGCAFPSERFDARAQHHGLQRKTAPGIAFTHVVFMNSMVERASGTGRRLHIYLGGDGSPMLGDFPNPDPTPRQPLTLDLMALDPSPAVFIGRPCYHGQSVASECTARLWTTERYGEAVVANLVAAARRVADTYGFRTLSLFGHSGGGTLAILMSARMPEVRELVTVAAVLDTVAWARLRRIPLDRSLNPVTHARASSTTLVQHHFAGGSDRVVPAMISVDAARRLKIPLSVVAGFDHTCCWVDKWPQILALLPNN